ncbi:MAG: YceI family protein [Bacteroidales bacterium]|nr:YceI family protein [Bacteroidales bacterium]
MKLQILKSILLSSFVLVTLTAHSQAGSKKATAKKVAVNTAESRVNWLGKKPGGEHDGYVKLTDGTIQLAGNEIAGGSFVIDMNSIVNLDLKDENMNQRLVGHLKSSDFFDVEKYPTASFVITKVSRLKSTTNATLKVTHRIEGDLTIKGITKSIVFDAHVSNAEGKVVASTESFVINRTLWNVNYQSKSIFAELKDQFINDDITLSVKLASN